MHSAFDIWSTFLDMLYSNIGRYLPHIALELHSAETTTSASQLEAHLQAVLVGFKKITVLLSILPVR
jgi:hypothetical protein